MKRHIRYIFLGIVALFIVHNLSAQQITATIYPIDSAKITSTSVFVSGKVIKGKGVMLMGKGFVYKRTVDSDNDYQFEIVNTADSIFSFTIENLFINTSYTIKTFGGTMDSIYFSDTVVFKTDNPLSSPIISTAQPTLVSSNSAELNGNLVEYGNPKVLRNGFLFGKVADLTYKNADTIIGYNDAPLGNYSFVKYNLSPSTTYYYRAVARRVNDTILGTVVSFKTTKESIILPALRTIEISDSGEVDIFRATLWAELKSLGNQEITERGIEYKQEQESSFKKMISLSTEIKYSVDLNDLKSSTTYIYRAYLQTQEGTVYGKEANFKTLAEPPIFTALEPTNITTNSVKLNGQIDKKAEKIQIYGFSLKEVGSEDKPKIYNMPADSIDKPFYVEVMGLKPYTEYSYKVFAIGIGQDYNSDEKIFKTLNIPPIVLTQVASSITDSSARFNGSIINSGIPNYKEKGFVYSSSEQQPSLSNSSKIISTSSNNLYRATVKGLEQNTLYYYASYLITDIDTVYGKLISFRTLESGEQIPVLTTEEYVEDITYNSALIKGSIVGTSTYPITEVGFEYKALHKPDFTTVKVNIAITNQINISLRLDTLIPNSIYEFRVYALNEKGKIYGEDMIFQTLPIPMIVTTKTATNIQITSALMRGSVFAGTETLLFTGFDWKKDSDDDYERVYLNKEELEYKLENLEPSTKYVYKVFSKAAGKEEVFGQELSFITLPKQEPILSIVQVSDIDTNSAKFTASFTQGTDEASLIMFAWKKKDFDSAYTTQKVEKDNIEYTVNNLASGTDYVVALYVVTQYGIKKGQENFFRTQGEVGLKEVAKTDMDISVYPNPSKDKVIIRLNNNKANTTMLVSDLQGRVLDKKKITTDIIDYRVNYLSKGIYTLTFITNDCKQTRKLIVE